MENVTWRIFETNPRLSTKLLPELLVQIYSVELLVEPSFPFFRVGGARCNSANLNANEWFDINAVTSSRPTYFRVRETTACGSTGNGKFAFRASNSNALFVINGSLYRRLEIVRFVRDSSVSRVTVHFRETLRENSGNAILRVTRSSFSLIIQIGCSSCV